MADLPPVTPPQSPFRYTQVIAQHWGQTPIVLGRHARSANCSACITAGHNTANPEQRVAFHRPDVASQNR